MAKGTKDIEPVDDAELWDEQKRANCGKPIVYCGTARDIAIDNARLHHELHRALLCAVLDTAGFKSARVHDSENKYTPMYRPAHGSAFPAGVKWVYVEAPANEPQIAARLGIPLSRFPFGVIALNRRLTPEERKEYQMTMV